MITRVADKILLIVTLIVLCVVSLPACQEMRSSDAWEARHNKAQPPGKVMDAIGVEPGWIVAEIGAGRGRYVVHMADRVGPKGKIMANDIDEGALDYLERRCERDDIPNVVTVLGELADPKLPPASCDMIYVINSYHHFEEPVELLRNALPALKQGGIMVIIEHDREKAPDAGDHSTSQEVLLNQMGEAGYELVRIETFLELDNINIFKPRMEEEKVE
jgi:ubiquinone/menaquinone biosynthesis C-methylase UbiE